MRSDKTTRVCLPSDLTLWEDAVALSHLGLKAYSSTPEMQSVWCLRTWRVVRDEWSDLGDAFPGCWFKDPYCRRDGGWARSEMSCVLLDA